MITIEAQIARFGMSKQQAVELKDWCVANLPAAEIAHGRKIWLEFIRLRRVDKLPQDVHSEHMRIYILSLLKLGLTAQEAFDLAVLEYLPSP